MKRLEAIKKENVSHPSLNPNNYNDFLFFPQIVICWGRGKKGIKNIDTVSKTLIRSDGSKNLYDYETKVNVFAHLLNSETGDEAFISNVLKFTGNKDE